MMGCQRSIRIDGGYRAEQGWEPLVYTFSGCCLTVAGPKIFERRGAEDNLSAPSSFIADAHSDL